ncbi:MAG TPA: MerC mercury resistance protein [Gammaproteobacteria bacterium]|nr:MerC mercury resistance protein [Gammaproteobacteria bacterium]
MLPSPSKPALDFLAMALSVICLIHCLSIPLALLLIPSFSYALLQSETLMHWILLGFAAPISMVTLYLGHRRHGVPIISVLGLAGLLFMLIGASHLFGRDLESALTVIGVSALFVAHWRNMFELRHAIKGRQGQP